MSNYIQIGFYSRSHYSLDPLTWVGFFIQLGARIRDFFWKGKSWGGEKYNHTFIKFWDFEAEKWYVREMLAKGLTIHEYEKAYPNKDGICLKEITINIPEYRILDWIDNQKKIPNGLIKYDYTNTGLYQILNHLFNWYPGRNSPRRNCSEDTSKELFLLLNKIHSKSYKDTPEDLFHFYFLKTKKPKK